MTREQFEKITKVIMPEESIMGEDFDNGWNTALKAIKENKDDYFNSLDLS